MPKGKGNWVVQHRILIIFILMAAIIIVGSLIQQIKPVAPAAPEQSVAAVGVEELFAAYRQDPAATDAAYRGKLLDVGGTAKSGGMSIATTPYVTLRPPNSIDEVRCMLQWDLKTIGMAAELSAGDIVVLRGRLKSYSTYITMEDCLIVQVLRSLNN